MLNLQILYASNVHARIKSNNIFHFSDKDGEQHVPASLRFELEASFRIPGYYAHFNLVWTNEGLGVSGKNDVN